MNELNRYHKYLLSCWLYVVIILAIENTPLSYYGLMEYMNFGITPVLSDLVIGMTVSTRKGCPTGIVSHV